MTTLATLASICYVVAIHAALSRAPGCAAEASRGQAPCLPYVPDSRLADWRGDCCVSGVGASTDGRPGPGGVRLLARNAAGDDHVQQLQADVHVPAQRHRHPWLIAWQIQ